MMMMKTLSSIKESAMMDALSGIGKLGADDIVDSSVKMANELSGSGVSLKSLKKGSKEYEAYSNFVKEGKYSDDVVKNVDDAINPNFKGEKTFDENIINHQQDLFNAETYSLNNTEKDGIGLWGLAKKHPVVSTAAVMTGVFGTSQIIDED